MDLFKASGEGLREKIGFTMKTKKLILISSIGGVLALSLNTYVVSQLSLSFGFIENNFSFFRDILASFLTGYVITFLAISVGEFFIKDEN